MQKVILAVLLIAGSAYAKPPPLKPIRINFVRVVDDATMPRGEVLQVVNQVRIAYQRLRLPFQFGPLRQIRVGFGPGLVADRLAYAKRIERKVRARARGIRTHTFVPMTTDGYSYGFAFSVVSIGTATSYNLRGEPRFWHTVTTAVHEIGHLLGVSHHDNEVNVMHSNALIFVTNGLLKFGWWMRDVLLGSAFRVDMCKYTFVPCLLERPRHNCTTVGR